MSSAESQNNYFFVVDSIDERYSNLGMLYAEGDGIEVVEALARMSILAAGNVDIDFRVSTAGSLMDSLSYRRFPQLSGQFNTEELSVVVGNLHARRLDHEDRMMSQVKEGVRSPQSVFEEHQQGVEDVNLLSRNMQNWFDRLGRRIVMPSQRQQAYQNENDEHLVLQPVHSNTRDDFIKPIDKPALFTELPKGATVQSAEVMPLAVDPHKSRSRKSRKLADAYLSEGSPIVHRTFGFLQDERFIPFVTELSPHHPAVVKQNKAASKSAKAAD